MRNIMNCTPIIDGLLSEILTPKYKKPRHGWVSRQRIGWGGITAGAGP